MLPTNNIQSEELPLDSNSLKSLSMREMKIRLQDDAKVEDIDLWLASGNVRVSRTSLLNCLVEAFHEEIVGKECTLENITASITTAVKIGRQKIDNQRFG